MSISVIAQVTAGDTHVCILAYRIFRRQKCLNEHIRKNAEDPVNSHVFCTDQQLEQAISYNTA